ncbi:NADH:flavin oxidoreductase/NADH oxidase [Bacillus sp. es.034]|uniref:NADH:flavin oxidoreductase/NADH oxidase n=1 Tax=Bacillus sp. es.034 TaxID=1761763 RepID=UPI000BF9F3ED|nr:NADH:flavin oxidoreductase/NADH oxidase [Bacillus sp. es.034]PFG04516.1 2,4-dienoyl-CoA reductase-like NADH-dependent reductase (Old Yellow Enzyme family) [Bacillus sp. es.034]
MAGLFDSYQLKDLLLKNRIVLSPMCQYQAKNEKGIPEMWHMIHLVSRAIGGTGLVLTEMTNVEARGRITENCLGIYSDEQMEEFKKINEQIHHHGAKSGIQIAHAGRKSVIKNGDIVGPSAIPFSPDSPVPRELSKGEIEEIIEAFYLGAKRSVAAGFDTIEIHGAHGYLLHQFLSPASNHRNDEFGDPAEFPVRVIKAIKEAVPDTMPVMFRISAVEYVEGGYSFEDTLSNCKKFIAAGVDLFDVSTGANSPIKPVVYPGYQVKYAARIKQELKIPVMSVGKLETPQLAEAVVQDGLADLICIGKGMLRQPYWAKEAAEVLSKELDLPGVYNMGF